MTSHRHDVYCIQYSVTHCRCHYCHHPTANVNNTFTGSAISRLSTHSYHINVCPPVHRCCVSLTYCASSFHFPPLSRTPSRTRPRWQVIISSAIVAGRGRRRHGGRVRTAAVARPRLESPLMTTESGRQRDAAVARRKLNRDYRLVSCTAIIRPRSARFRPSVSHAGTAALVRPGNDLATSRQP